VVSEGGLSPYLRERILDELIHKYFGVDMGIVWKVIEIELPKLKERVRQLLAE